MTRRCWSGRAPNRGRDDGPPCRSINGFFILSLLWLSLRSAALPGLTPEVVARDLDRLGALFAPIGLPPNADAARLPRLLAILATLQAETGTWARANEGEPIAAVAAMVSTAAAYIIGAATALVREARALAADVPALLRQWSRGPDEVTARIARTEWLLDGWDRIALLWHDARWPAAQRAALLDMGQLVPDLPLEAGDWTGPRPASPVAGFDCLPLLRQAPAGGDAGALEATARHLRELESEARVLGGGDAYDKQLRDASASVRACGTAVMSLAERVRLVEILEGPEAAMALLKKA